MPDKEKIFPQLQNQLEQFQTLDLCQGIAALQVVPQNACHLLRLEFLAGLMAGLPPKTDGPCQSLHRWRLLVQSSEASRSLERMEDPFPNLFTQQIVTPMGSFRVFSGPLEGEPFALQMLCEALSFGIEEDNGFEGLRDEVMPTLTAALSLVDRLVERVGLGKEQNSQSRVDKFKFPDSRDFDALKQSVTFDRPDFDSLFECPEVGMGALDPLITELGETCVEVLDVEANRLVARPIVRSGETFVVLAPGAMLTALRHWIACQASQRGLLSSLAKTLVRAVVRSVSRSLDRLHWTPVTEPFFEDGATVGHMFFQFDRTKLAHVVVEVSSCEAYSTETVRQPAALKPNVDDLLEVGRHKLARYLEEGFETLHLVIFERFFGESLVVSGPRKVRGNLVLPVSTEALDVMTLSEMGEPLALWYFALHSERLNRVTDTMPFGPLDEFALYRGKDYSFYLSDETAFTHMTISSDIGADLRHQMEAKFRPMGAKAPGTTRDLLWRLMHPGTDYPLYCSLETVERPIFRLEAMPLPCWVTTPRKLATPLERKLYVDLVDSTLYWLWQAAPSLEPYIEGLRGMMKYLHMLIHIVPGDAWQDSGASPDLPAVESRLLPDNTLVLTFASASLQLANRSDNSWDRAVVRSLLEGIVSLVERATFNIATPLNAARIDEIVERHAPFGLKKIFLPVPVRLTSRLLDGELPEMRILQQPVIQLLLDELGEYLNDKGELIEGKLIPESDITPLLRDHVVAFFYKRLQESVAELDPERLLEMLVAHNEKLVQDAARIRFLLPSRVACFGQKSTTIQQFSEALQENARASVANRFLIEYVTARPPTGTRKFDLSIYDRLLGIAYEIANWGRISDLVHYKLGSFEFRLLPSGRLGCHRGRFEETTDAYTKLLYGQKAQLQLDSFEDSWEQSGLGIRAKPQEASELDEATRAEFGLSLTELVDFLSFLAAHCRKHGDQIVIEFSSLLGMVVAEMDWRIQKAETALNLFALNSRDNFLSPEKPFALPDVVPWRFSRSLSYLRRPLLIRQKTDVKEVVFGHRGLRVAYEYLVDLCSQGNFKAGSSPLRSYNAKVKADCGEVFNDQVAELLATRDHLEVRPRMKKFAGRRITRPNGQDLGDIDVLVIIRDRRRLLAIETKDLKLAKTPPEIGRELKSNFALDDASSAMNKHAERIAWLRDHLDLVQEELGIKEEKRKSWKVEGLFVVSADLFSPYLFKTAMPVISIRELRKDGGKGVLSRLASRRKF